MPEINWDRHKAVYEYVLAQGNQVNSWPNTAEIIAMAIEVALNHDSTTTNN